MGKGVGTQGAIIHQFGDSVLYCKEIWGDSLPCRHGQVKQHIVAKDTLAGLPIDCEVYGLFSDLLPVVLQEEGGELQWGRARQDAVPGFKITLPTPKGLVHCLAEFKCINAGRKWYPRGQAGKRTERPDQLPYE